MGGVIPFRSVKLLARAENVIYVLESEFLAEEVTRKGVGIRSLRSAFNVSGQVSLHPAVLEDDGPARLGLRERMWAIALR